MENSAVAGKVSFWRKPFALWVIFGGLLYPGLAFLAFAAPVLLTGNPFVLFFLIFAVILILSSLAGLVGKRWALAVTSGVSIFLLVLFGLFASFLISNPASSFFALFFSILPPLALAAIFSVLALANAKTGIAQKKYLATPRSSGGLLTLSLVGFVVGGLVVGNIAAIEIQRLLDEGGTGAGVRVVPNAVSAAVPFSPDPFTVAAGTNVIWYNADTMFHTATSDDGITFDGDLPSGESFTFRFTTPGSYTYHCKPHDWMKGTIVVTP